MSDLLSAIRAAKLKPADTVETTADGRRFVHSKDTSTVVEVQGGYGFVVDTKPDDVPAEIVQGLFLGSQDCCEPAVLDKFGIRRVLSVGVRAHPEVEAMFVECLDLPETDLGSIVAECNAFIGRALEDGVAVLVHCNAGVSRSAAVVMGYLMVVRGMSYEEARCAVKRSRSCAQPNAGFDRQLKELVNS